tara:strand:- start:102 stop:488 length:387 start_codon:yes stop_codon:yes gene_type:complete
MVAHGTIAFDTLTTSDQVKTGTEKSIDTSYLFNGVAKCVCHYTTAGTFVNNFSFNTSSLTDGGAGDCRVNFTNTMGATNGYSGTRSVNTFHILDSEDNTAYVKTISYDSSNNPEDSSRTQVTVHGDLA